MMKINKYISETKLPLIYSTIFILLIISLILRIPTLFISSFDPDEFEHLHASRNIYHGMLPYKDYFQHHTPFFHFFLALLYGFLPDKIPLIFLCRFIMFAFSCIILYLTYRLANLLYGLKAALYAVLFLSYVNIFQEKTIEIRPDVPGVTLWLLAIIFFISGIKYQGQDEGKRQRHFQISGIMIAGAVLTIQKAIFALIGLFLAWIWILFDKQASRLFKKRFTSLIWFGFGVFIPFSITCFYFFLHNALGDFIYRTFIMCIQWVRETRPYAQIMHLVRQNPFFCIFSLAGLFIATFRLSKKRRLSNDCIVPLFSTYTLIVGLFLIPVPHKQYFLLFLPLLAIYCGFAFDKLIVYCSWTQVQELWSKQTHWRSSLKLIFFMIMVFGYLFTYIKSLSTLPIKNIPIFSLWIWMSLLPFLVWFFIKGKRQCFALVLLIGTLIYPLINMFGDFSRKDLKLYHSNRLQLEQISFILQNTSSEDTIFDGWSGLGVFRNHAYYYYFLHSAVQKILTPQELSEDILDILRNRPPKIVIYDKFVRILPIEVRNYIEENYERVGIRDIYIIKNHYLE